MKKTTYLLLTLYLLSLGYATIRFLSVDEAFLLSFLNAAGAFSIILFLVMMLLVLSGFGYFDVFGYSFKKTYLMFTRKHNKMHLEDKEKYNSYYDYTQFKNQNRFIIKPSVIVYVLGFVLLNVILSYMYAYL